MRYDAAGNQVFDNWSDPTATNTFEQTYDAENRMKTTGQVGSMTNRYVYNADGQRVNRIVGSAETWYVYGIGGELVAEYATLLGCCT